MPNFRELLFDIQHQEGNFWCWAAVAASISKFYDRDSYWTQCKIACGVFNDRNCCPGGQGSPCDVRGKLDRALKKTGNLIEPAVRGPLNEAEIVRQIELRRVIGVLVKWDNGFGHFVVIHGYDFRGARPDIFVADPLHGSKCIPLYALTDNYWNKGGAWAYTFFTKPEENPVMANFSTLNKSLFRIAESKNYSRPVKKMHAINFSEPIPKTDAIPQTIYDVNWTLLVEKKALELLPAGFRFIQKNRLKQFILVDHDIDIERGQIQQILYDRSFVNQYKETVDTVTRTLTVLPGKYTFNLIQIPRMKIEVLWLQNELEQDKDQYIPFYSSEKLQKGEVYSKTVLLEKILQTFDTYVPSDDPLLGS